ncbi:MAG: Holliday junction resolvase RuvX [Bacteroidetes bacterium]|nr:Holliday junction resolvase RuvX [Bacteroidota bacterium]
MPRILSIDYGLKRVGIAVTDPLKIIAKPLETIDNHKIFDFLKSYLQKEEVELIVVGDPRSESGELQQMQIEVKQFVNKLKQIFPNIPVVFEDERYTSRMAQQSLIDFGVKKSKRKDKKILDTVSAALILQSYLERHS